MVNVSDGNPVCSRNTTQPNEAIEGECIKMSCKVPYKGCWAPVISWKQNGSSLNTVVDESTDGVVKYSITVIAIPGGNSNVYSSEIKFDAPIGTGPNEATNKPDYTFNYQFQPLTVWCECFINTC